MKQKLLKLIKLTSKTSLCDNTRLLNLPSSGAGALTAVSKSYNLCKWNWKTLFGKMGKSEIDTNRQVRLDDHDKIVSRWNWNLILLKLRLLFRDHPSEAYLVMFPWKPHLLLKASLSLLISSNSRSAVRNFSCNKEEEIDFFL